MDDSASPEWGEPADGESMAAMGWVVQQLYEVMGQDLVFDEKARQALELGRQFLSVDNGHLTRIDEETDHWEVLVSTDSPDGTFPPGLELDLTNTYCRHVVDSGSQMSRTNAPNQGWEDDSAFETHGLHCYLGTPVVLDEDVYGTLCFVSADPRKKPFSEGEKMVAELISHMLERELERDQYESKLTKQTNLSIVLNRVLRHNLRNGMAVIRGHTQMMADANPDPTGGQIALKHIDKLIKLGEKARILDEIVASDEERDETNIRTIVDEVVAGVRNEYPSASISIEAEDEITGAALPSFKRAMRELVENAVKHGGDQPTVDVVLELVPNAIEIQIADNGSGLDTQELGVLRSGAETPLLHGSGLGLWIAHWIVSNHEGSIDATVTDEGTTLTITVPRTSMTGAHQRVGELVRARDQYKAAFDEAGDGMIIADDEGRILEANEEAARIYGKDRLEVIGRSLREFVPDDFDFETEWGEIQSTKSTRDEMKIVSADGGVIPIEYTSKTDVVPGQHLIVSRDISERKEQERELQHKQARFKAVFEDSFDGMVIADDTGTYIEVNESAAELFGVPREELLGRSIDEFAPADFDFDAAWHEFQEFEDERGTFPLVRPDGSKRIVEYAATTDIIPGQHLSVLRDVTERKEQKKTLRETNQQLEAIIELSPDPILATDASGTVFLWNQAAENVFKISAEEAIGEQIESLLRFSDEQSARFQERFDRILDGETLRDIEVKRERNDRSTIDLNISASPLRDGSDSVTGMIGIAQDITGRKSREEELVQYEAAFVKAGDGMTIADDEAHILDVNEEAARIYGEDRRELAGRSMQEFLPDDFDFEAEWGAIQAAKMKRDEMEIISADGGTNAVEYTAKTDILPGQHLIVSRDITEHKKQEKRFQEFIDHSNDVISVLGGDGTYTYQSPSSHRVVGYDAAELVGENAFEYVHPDDHERVMEAFREAIEDPEMEATTEYRFLHGDGSYRWLASRGNNQLNNPAIEGFVINSRDITERKKREQELQRERDRLDRFAGVVSHDLRNPLNVATGRLALATEECETEHLETATAALDRMEILIDDVLTLARAGETVGESEFVELDELIGGCWRNVDTKSTELLAETDAAIRADETRLSQLFENLFRNAVEHGGGDLTVTVGELDDGFYVEDDGVGIPEAAREKVFEAAYSSQDEGTGFGLSIVKQIAEAHDWDIRVTEGTDGGARFEITGVVFAAE